MYQYCLNVDEAIDLCCLRRNSRERPKLSHIDVNPIILRSNRQSFSEALGILYGQNFFYVTPVAGLEASEASESCLACCAQRRAIQEETSEPSLLDQGWTDSTSLVRRLIIVLSPYTLLE